MAENSLGSGTSTADVRNAECRIVIVDEAKLIHLALRVVFTRTPRFSLVGSASAVPEARSIILQLKPDILLCEVDIAGNNGLELCDWTRSASPRTSPVILTSRDDPLLARSALDSGALGYLLKTSPPEDLVFHLQSVRAGRRVLDDRIGRCRTTSWENHQNRFGLSPRECEVLEEVVLGLDNRTIAGRLCIAHDTVKSHIKAILRKIGARDRAHAIALVLSARPSEVPGPRRPQ
ncbi:LuxR C-terminal-related transcriptional regulator [Sinosporangium siamense]|uniref:DNA-binding response regulator n=1 Tax=Sinosporangium siamense TaxID=1367973 RepID=A0A919RMG1_9ACTN|nr:response regulator transcription factor [Sinosporangium siamense]GII96263.1 DNA-binding response regulator [Sinosporangium siamense]